MPFRSAHGYAGALLRWSLLQYRCCLIRNDTKRYVSERYLKLIFLEKMLLLFRICKEFKLISWLIFAIVIRNGHLSWVLIWITWLAGMYYEFPQNVVM